MLGIADYLLSSNYMPHEDTLYSNHHAFCTENIFFNWIDI